MSLGLLQDCWVWEEKLDVFVMSSEIQGLIIWLGCFNFKESERKKKKYYLLGGLKTKSCSISLQAHWWVLTFWKRVSFNELGIILNV